MAGVNVARFVANNDDRYVRHSGNGYDCVGLVSFPATRTCLCVPSHRIMLSETANLSHEVMMRHRLCMGLPFESVSPQAQLCTVAECKFHLFWNWTSSGISHPRDESGHSNDISPPCLSATSAMTINWRNKCLLCVCCSLRFARYLSPYFRRLTTCH